MHFIEIVSLDPDKILDFNKGLTRHFYEMYIQVYILVTMLQYQYWKLYFDLCKHHLRLFYLIPLRIYRPRFKERKDRRRDLGVLWVISDDNLEPSTQSPNFKNL